MEELPESRAGGRPDRAPVGALSSAVVRRVVRTLIPMLLLLSAGVGAVVLRERARDRSAARRSVANVVRLQASTLQRAVDMATSVFEYLGEQRALQQFLSGGPRDELEREYVQLCRMVRVFDQVRVLDLEGRELLRVDALGGEPRVVPPEQLQGKADRYYFGRARDLPAGRVYVSPFDLNEERGEVEEPWRPVIRFAAPVTDLGGEVRGVLVLNYLGESVLRILRQAGEQVPGWTALVTGEGYYLEAPDPGRSFGFHFGLPPTFEGDHPGGWERMGGDVARAVHFAPEGMYAHCAVRAPRGEAAVRSDLDLRAVGFVPAATLYAASRRTQGTLLAGSALVALVLAAVAWRLAFVGAVRDAEARRLAASERGLHRLSERLLNAQEDERRSLSRDLHDELGQQATAISIELKRARRTADPAERERLLDRSVEAADGLLEGVQKVAARLRSSHVDDLGLQSALRAMCSEFEERAHVETNTDLDLEGVDVPANVARSVYRFVQEGLNNVAKHSGAREVVVSVRVEEGRLIVAVQDDGVGFEYDPDGMDGLGLLGMRERVDLLKGEFACVTGRGRGARVEASIPLAEGAV